MISKPDETAARRRFGGFHSKDRPYWTYRMALNGHPEKMQYGKNYHGRDGADDENEDYRDGIDPLCVLLVKHPEMPPTDQHFLKEIAGRFPRSNQRGRLSKIHIKQPIQHAKKDGEYR
ncbi:MAG: hypothetical protein JW929_16015 [Anaerolineales bacterium]|nr:hypothetical protein [Anaerolineales bacterium]